MVDESEMWRQSPPALAPLTPTQRLLVIGIYLNGALYLVGCFLAGLITTTPPAWKAALAALGFSYLGYTAQVMGANRLICMALVGLSVGVGGFAGAALLF